MALEANASDSDGTVTLVEFFAGSTLLGSDTTNPYNLTWANAPVGSFSLTARATDNSGAMATSSVVNVTVRLPQPDSIKLWLKADAITGLSDGAAVATWPDSSGLTNNATQPSAPYQPQFVTNGVNGLPVMRFDGVTEPLNATLLP